MGGDVTSLEIMILVVSHHLLNVRCSNLKLDICRRVRKGRDRKEIKDVISVLVKVREKNILPQDGYNQLH